MSKTDVVVGSGEIGTGIAKVIEGDVFVYDIKDGELGNEWGEEETRLLNICIPYFEGFEKEVEKYQKFFKPEYTVIHSTVPVGTSRKCKAVHSPVLGMHPNLYESLKTFTKFFGGEDASYVADMFRRFGLKVYVTDKPETTELMKILCTTNYGLTIEFTKEVKRLCDRYKVPFEIFTIWNNNYNEGYEKLGHPEYHRYNLVPLMKKIGGHCVLNNYELLDSEFIKFLKQVNEKETVQSNKTQEQEGDLGDV